MTTKKLYFYLLKYYPNKWSVLSLNNPKNDKILNFKCPSEGDKNVEYFTSLMEKIAHTKNIVICIN
jgi:hypothetical protein